MASTTFSGPVLSQNGFATTTTAGVASANISSGAGAPTHSAPQGSLYLNTTGSSTSTRLYVNSTGSTTWVAVTTAS